MAAKQAVEEKLQIIKEAMQEIAHRPELSQQAKERGIRSLQIAYDLTLARSRR